MSEQVEDDDTSDAEFLAWTLRPIAKARQRVIDVEEFEVKDAEVA